METPRARSNLRPALPPRMNSKALLQAVFSTKKPLLPNPRRSPSITSLNSSISTRSSSSASSHRDTPESTSRLRNRSSSETRKSYHILNNIPTVTASSWCIMEGNTGHVVYGHCDIEPREIASLTKIMTCYVVLKLLGKTDKITMDSVIKVSEKAASMIGTSAELRCGDEITVKDILHGLMLPSGNDAAWALAEYFGSFLNPNSSKPVSHFLSEMNKTARELGLDNTSYGNPHGLVYKRNLSTARDVCKLASVAMRDETFRGIVGTKAYTSEIWNDGEMRQKTWENTNKLLNKGFEGVKTGITNKAGPCLCASFKKDTRMIVVLLNSKSMDARWIEAKKIVEWGTVKYSCKP